MKKQLLNIALLLATAGAAKAQVSFAPAVNYTVGANPYGVFSADFNGDGKMDLVTPNTGGTNLSVLLGSGTGTFSAAVNYAAGSNPSAVFSADFNGDGKMDLATTNQASNDVSILLGSGTGTFAAPVNYAVGASPMSIFSADFNGDGKKDLATANLSSANVSILLGSGTGTFAAHVDYAVGLTPLSVFSADFNGDSKMDLVAANFDNNNISVLLGSGTGTFATAVNYAVGTNPESVYSADFNGDGKMDLASANLGSNNVSVLLGSGSGTFAAAVNYSTGFFSPISVFSADFNGDGKMDLATANQSGDNVSVLLGSGSGTFAAAINYAVASTPMYIFSADFNGDGRADLVTPSQSSNNVSVLLNNTLAASLNFDGANDFVNIPNNSSFNFGTNDFTIETWAKTSSVAGNRVMIGKINGGNNFWFGVSNGKANFSLIGGPDALGTSTIGDGNWHHLAAVRQNGVVSLYVDGVLEATQNNTGNATINGDLTLGNFSGGFNFFGSLDEVRIWNRALCKGELLNNKNKELALTQTGLVSYYKFNQGGAASNNSTVTILNDLSGNANNGTLNNFALSGTTSNWVAPGAVTSGSLAPTYTPISANVLSQVNVLCNGGNNGSATVTTTGGTSPYTYLASTGATVSTLSNLTAGAYTYTVTDANTCKAIKTLTITQPSALVTNTTVTNVLCNGGNTGTATVTTTGGTSPYTYLASTGATVSTLSNLTAGAYTYTVTDNHGCIKTQAFTITEPDILGTGLGIWAVSCNGLNDGQLSIIGIQGTAPYTYSWSTGATTQTITSLSPGVYTVTVTDANGCVAIRTKTITEPPPITVTITASNSTICSGSSSTLTANTTGNFPPFSYSWVAGPTASVSVVSPTSTTVYTVNVTDDNSCVQTATVSVTANVCTPAEALSFDGVNDYVYVLNNNSFGFGTNDFTIETWEKTSSTTGNRVMLSKINGTSNYWMGVSNGKAIFSMTGGPDAVGATTIGDGNWHHIAAVRQNGVVSLYVDGVMEASQNNNGNVAIGGNFALGEFNGGYNFVGSLDEVRIWNTARTQCEINTYKNCEIPSNATALLANYHFNQGNAAVNNAGLTSLMDATSNNFTGTLANFTLNGATSNWIAPGGVVSGNTTPATAPTITVNSGTLCSGQSFTITPSGADTYTFSSGSDVVMPTTDATYTVSGTVSATGCSNTAVSSITVNPLPTVFSNPGNVHTCGDVSATFGVSSAGTNSYQWYFEYTQLPNDSDLIDGSYTEINFDTDTMTIQQVLTGNYNNYYVYCEVTNQYGCKAYSANDTIWANPSPTVTVNSGTICTGESFTMVPSGADTYSYSNGSNVVSPSSDATYTVTGTDATTGCENTTTSIVTVNTLPTLSVITTNTLLCAGETATLSVSGASTYTWSTTETTVDIAVTPSVQTTYTVEGTDSNGCSNTTTITQDVSLCTGVVSLTNDASVNVYPNPNKGTFVVELTSESKVTIINALGQVIISETFEAGKHTININNESTGVYFAKVMTNNRQQIIKVIKE